MLKEFFIDSITMMFKLKWNVQKSKIRSGRVIYGKEGFRF